MDLGIDLEELEKLKDPIIKDVIRQLKENDIAYTTDDTISGRISRKLPKLRDMGVLVIAPDRRLNKNIIGIDKRVTNPAVCDMEAYIQKQFKKMLRSLK